MWRSLLVTFAVLAFAAPELRADDELPNAVPTVMHKRWSAAFALGPALLRARTETTRNHIVGFGDFAVRYRVIAPIEIGLAGSLGVSGGFGYVAPFLDVRYRALAESDWNPFVLFSLGIASFGSDDASRIATRGGLGLERRFTSWAFSADAQLALIGAGDETTYGGGDSQLREHGAWSGSFSVAAVYYFGFGAKNVRGRVP